MPAVLVYEGFEDGPLHATDEAVCGWQVLGFGKDLSIEEQDCLLDLVEPLVPVLPHPRSLVPLLAKQLNPVVQLPHPLGNLPGCFGLPHTARGERGGIQVLLEPTILERSQQPRTDLLAGEPPKHAQLVLSVNQMLHLGPVDSQQYLARLFLAGFPG